MKAMVNIEASMPPGAAAVALKMAVALHMAIVRGQNNVAISISESLRGFAPQVSHTAITSSNFQAKDSP